MVAHIITPPTLLHTPPPHLNLPWIICNSEQLLALSLDATCNTSTTYFAANNTIQIHFAFEPRPFTNIFISLGNFLAEGECNVEHSHEQKCLLWDWNIHSMI
jgi:hypothetical protein